MADEEDKDEEEKLAAAWQPSAAKGLLDKANASLEQLGQKSGVQQTFIPDTSDYFPNAVRAADYAQRGLPTGPVAQGGDPVPVGFNNPQTGNFINPTGQNLGPTNVNGRYQGNPPGAVGIQGALSPEEQAFWGANPNGAIKDPQTGNLIGLGTATPALPAVNENGMVTVNAGLGPPGTPYNQQTRVNEGLGPPSPKIPDQRVIPDFIQIPEINPVVIAQRQQLQNEIMATRNELRGASSARFKGQPSQREILSQRLNTLTDANNSLGLEFYRQTEAQRKATDENRGLQDKYITHQDVMEATKAIAKIQAPHGSDEFKKQYFDITDRYPNAMKDAAFKADVLKTAQFHDERAAARERAIAAGLVVQDVGVGQKGVSQKFVDPNAVPNAAQSRMAKIQGDLLYHSESATAQKAIDKGKLPYKGMAVQHALEKEMQELEKSYPGLKPQTEEAAPAKIRKYNPKTGKLE